MYVIRRICMFNGFLRDVDKLYLLKALCRVCLQLSSSCSPRPYTHVRMLPPVYSSAAIRMHA